MRSFQKRLADFDARGVRIAALSVDSPEANQPHRARLGVNFPLLSDQKAQVIRRYDLLDAGAGIGGADVARPAEFLIDSAGIVRWVNLTESYTARARPQQVLDAIDAMKE